MDFTELGRLFGDPIIQSLFVGAGLALGKNLFHFTTSATCARYKIEQGPKILSSLAKVNIGFDITTLLVAFGSYLLNQPTLSVFALSFSLTDLIDHTLNHLYNSAQLALMDNPSPIITK